MLYASAEKFDVTRNFENFLVFLGEQGPSAHPCPPPCDFVKKIEMIILKVDYIARSSRLWPQVRFYMVSIE